MHPSSRPSRTRLTPSIRLLLTCALATLAPGCSWFETPLPMIPSEDPGPYRLDSGDQVRVAVFGQDQLTGTYVVSDTGDISIPLVGSVPVRGLTNQDLESTITTSLKQGGFLVNPSVSVEILHFRPFYILGEVRSPGQHDYVPGMNVLTGVAIAGGFTYRADTDHVSIVRNTPDGSIEGQADRSTPVQPGDVIYVNERFF